MRIFAVSDLHTDFTENRRRLEQISSTSYLHDTLVHDWPANLPPSLEMGAI